jgi:hypothetical protein
MQDDDGNIHYRLKRLEEATIRLEDTDQKLNNNLNELVLNTKLMAQTLEMLTTDIQPKLSKLDDKINTLERNVDNAALIIGAVKWLAVTVGGIGVLMVIKHLFGGG